MTEPTSDLVKRLETAGTFYIAERPVDFPVTATECCDLAELLYEAARAIRALEAAVGRSRKQVAALTTALELAGDEVVDFETAIRSRSNGAEPETENGVTARSQGASPISAFGSDSADALSEGGE